MEDKIPQIKVTKDQLKGQHPPWLESDVLNEEEQWINDTKHAAICALKDYTLEKKSVESSYTPFVRKMSDNNKIREHLLTKIKKNTYRTKHPQVNKMWPEPTPVR